MPPHVHSLVHATRSVLSIPFLVLGTLLFAIASLISPDATKFVMGELSEEEFEKRRQG